MFTIRPPFHHEDTIIEDILDAAFRPHRKQKTSYTYRRGINEIQTLHRVCLDDSVLVGSIQYWPVGVRTDDGGITPALLLGPIGVHQGWQNRGVGAELMYHSLNAAREQGYGIVFLVGDLLYYGRFGFSPATKRHITMPNEDPQRVLVRELANDALRGVTGQIVPCAGTD